MYLSAVRHSGSCGFKKGNNIGRNLFPINPFFFK